MWTGLLDERNSRQHYTDLRREAYVERLFKRTDRGDATWKEGIRLRLLLALILLVSMAWLSAGANPPSFVPTEIRAEDSATHPVGTPFAAGTECDAA